MGTSVKAYVHVPQAELHESCMVVKAVHVMTPKSATCGIPPQSFRLLSSANTHMPADDPGLLHAIAVSMPCCSRCACKVDSVDTRRLGLVFARGYLDACNPSIYTCLLHTYIGGVQVPRCKVSKSCCRNLCALSVQVTVCLMHGVLGARRVQSCKHSRMLAQHCGPP